MSCSVVYFSISGASSLNVVDTRLDVGDIFRYLKGDMSKLFDDFRLVFESKIVYDEYGEGYAYQSNFVRQIVLCDALPDGDIVPSTYAIVVYHHSGDPTDLEVVCEVGKILKELGYNLRNF